MRLSYVLLVLYMFSTTVFAKQVAIIIDDIGYRQSDVNALSLPANVTFSVLPHTPLGQTLARQAHSQGHEIMLHLPMQALNGKKLGPGGLTNQMSEHQVKQTIKQALHHIPFAKGANNHMGSLLTQLNQPMSWVLESLKQHQIYFVDSVTTKHTKVAPIAESIGIPLLKRQVFLDNQKDKTALEAQFTQLIQLANANTSVVAIAHPYPETIDFLKKNISRLSQQGIQLVPTSQLLPLNIANKDGASPAVRLR